MPKRAPTASGTRPTRRPSPRRCAASRRSVTEEAKPSTQSSPLLYDLTTLQREANSRFGFSAKTTLSLAQALYEKHKVLTYPRTDSRALPEDYVGVVKNTMKMIASEDLPGPLRALAQHATQGARRRATSSRTSASSTTPRCRTTSRSSRRCRRRKSLTEIEAKLYDMVVKRFLAVFYPAGRVPGHDAHHAPCKAAASEHSFQTNGKVLVKPGLAGGLRQGGAGRRRQPGRRCSRARWCAPRASTSIALKTKPPARYTEATLLSRDGRRRQADRRRRAARGDAGEGPRHAGHARGDHRRPDLREVHASRRPRAGARPPRPSS